MYKDKNFYLNLFQVSEAQLERLADRKSVV